MSPPQKNTKESERKPPRQTFQSVNAYVSKPISFVFLLYHLFNMSKAKLWIKMLSLVACSESERLGDKPHTSDEQHRGLLRNREESEECVDVLLMTSTPTLLILTDLAGSLHRVMKSQVARPLGDVHARGTSMSGSVDGGQARVGHDFVV